MCQCEWKFKQSFFLCALFVCWCIVIFVQCAVVVVCCCCCCWCCGLSCRGRVWEHSENTFDCTWRLQLKVHANRFLGTIDNCHRLHGTRFVAAKETKDIPYGDVIRNAETNCPLPPPENQLTQKPVHTLDTCRAPASASIHRVPSFALVCVPDSPHKPQPHESDNRWRLGPDPCSPSALVACTPVNCVCSCAIRPAIRWLSDICSTTARASPPSNWYERNWNPACHRSVRTRRHRSLCRPERFRCNCVRSAWPDDCPHRCWPDVWRGRYRARDCLRSIRDVGCDAGRLSDLSMFNVLNFLDTIESNGILVHSTYCSKLHF